MLSNEAKKILNMFLSAGLCQIDVQRSSPSRRLNRTDHILQPDIENNLLINRTPSKAISYTGSKLSTMSKAILEYEDNPANIERLLHELNKDSEIIRKMETYDIINDPDYIDKMRDNQIGFYMERYISSFCKCPTCGSYTLRIYRNPCMPVVDLICINTAYHLANNKCFMYQVKTKKTGSVYFNNDYISVGSATFGLYSHILKGNHTPDYKKLFGVGYICISYDYKEDTDTYSIIEPESFCMLPNLDLTLDKQYYEYTADYRYIKMNKDMLLSIKLFGDDGIFLSIYKNFKINIMKEIELKNPYCEILKDILGLVCEMAPLRIVFDQGGGYDQYYKKYIKYKTKYLELKKKIDE